MSLTMRLRKLFFILLTCLIATLSIFAYATESTNLLNVSYDPTRELYKDYNKIFVPYWKAKTGQEVKIEQSHGGSGAQARAVLNGLKADVVTLALAYDIDMIALKGKLIPLNWQTKFSNRSCPYTSTIVFLVRKGNPKHIKDWIDLIRPGVQVITPNPKTSGGARWNYLAAWGYALQKNHGGGGEAAAKEFITKLYDNVPILDAGARAATTTFAQRGIGDVLVTWENEAFLALNEFNKDTFEIVVPSVSILTEPPVAVVEHNTNERGTTLLANAYLAYLYSTEAQVLIAKHYYRPFDLTVMKKYANQFPKIKLFTIKDLGGWKAMQKKHFDDGGLFDSIYKK